MSEKANPLTLVVAYLERNQLVVGVADVGVPVEEELVKVLGQQQVDEERLARLADKDLGERVDDLERSVHDLVVLGLEHNVDAATKERVVKVGRQHHAPLLECRQPHFEVRHRF